MKRILLALTALAFQAAHAQIATQVQTTAVSPSLEVQRLAPQLIAFAGSEVNFANLVNGLALGVPVTLTTPLATGGMQVFTFTPTGTMTSLQIAQTLETARQSLIARGVGTPSAQQIGATLAGGTLNTALGATPVNALINTTTTANNALTGQSPATAIQGTTAGGLPTGAATASTSAAAGSTVRNMSDSPFGRGISDTPPLPVPGVTAPVPNVTQNEAIRPVTPQVATPITTTPTPIAPPALLTPPTRTGDR
jgi:hypothetical protein